MNRQKQLRILWILPIVASIFSLVTHANTLASLLLFWGLPSVLLTLWAPKHALKAALFAIVTSAFLMVINIIFYTTHQWYVVSMFNNRLLGFIAWEDIPYFFLFVYFPVMFWEHFYDKVNRGHAWSKRMSYLAGLFLIVALLIIGAWIWTPNLVLIPYFYFVATVLLVAIPIGLEALARPKLALRFIHVSLFYAFVGILYELTALYLGQWYFPSEKFFGWIIILGLKFPIEELFAWIILGAAFILTWYEYFDDDNR